MGQEMINIAQRKSWVPGDRKDPFLTYNFVVIIGGLAIAGFSEVSGLTVETEVERKTFGGENHRQYQFFKETKYSDITLKHGITVDSYLWDWYKQVADGIIVRQNGSVCLLDDLGNSLVWWDFEQACPIKWEGPSFNASGNSVAVESIVLIHNGLKMHK